MIIGGVELGNLPNYLFFFQNGSVEAEIRGPSKGYLGDIAINGNTAIEKTAGTVPYSGTMITNSANLGAWQNIINDNIGQANALYSQSTTISSLTTDIFNAFSNINSLLPTSGFESINALSLDGLNTQNGIAEIFVINITSGFDITQKINITGDADDFYILRWDTDADSSNGYQGTVKFHIGGAIVPHGGLKVTNFIHVAGDIDSSGGGNTPLPPYPQGPRYNDGQGDLINNGADFYEGGFFTGYWLTTGSPANYDSIHNIYFGETSNLRNCVFVGGWYSISNKIFLATNSSGVHISPILLTPQISIKKLVSVDGGATFIDADTPPGPDIVKNVNPIFKFLVFNTGNVNLTNIIVTDDVFGDIGTLPSLMPNNNFEWILTAAWESGEHQNTAYVFASYGVETITANDKAYYYGLNISINIQKFISVDSGATYQESNFPPGPLLPCGILPKFKFIITNTGEMTLKNIKVVDSVLGEILMLEQLESGAIFEFIV